MWNPKKNINFAQLQGFCDVKTCFVFFLRFDRSDFNIENPCK